MKYSYIIIVLLCVILNSCSKKKSRVVYPEINDLEQIELTDRAISLNDQNAYLKLAEYYGIWGMLEKMLLTSIEMANKNNYPQAYYDVYWILTHSEGYNGIDKLDTKTKYLALYYLLKSYELDPENSKYDVDKIFKNDSIPNANYYLIEMTKIQ